MQKFFTFTLYIIILISFAACSEEIVPQDNEETSMSKSKVKVTFVELGSVKCVPCIQMQPIMKSVEEKYGEQIRVIFYDVWTDEGHKYAKIYNIQLIPTQVFLDENENEIFRHVGFFPEAEIDKFLQEQGLQIIN